MLRKFIYLFVIIVLLFSVGCAGKMVHVNEEGVKLPSSIYIAKDTETGIEIKFYMAGIVNDTGSPYANEYLDIENMEVNELAYATKQVAGKMQILNPNCLHYHVIVLYEIDYRNLENVQGNGYKLSEAYVLYNGNAA